MIKKISVDPTGVIHMSSTLCKNCIFADYDKEVQIGCKANRLEKFEQANIPILELNEDNNESSLIVEGKVCVYYRNKEWMKSKYEDKSEADILDIVKKELRIPYHVLLFVRKEDTVDSLKLRLSELENQKIKPKIVTIIRLHTTHGSASDIMKLCQQNSFDHWRIQTIPTVDQIDTDIIDLAYDSTKSMKYMFYITLECSQPIPSAMSKDIHKSLHDDMKAFSVLLPNSNNVGRGALKAAHAKHAGNSFTILLEDKIKHYDDAPHLIKKVEEICPSLQTS